MESGDQRMNLLDRRSMNSIRAAQLKRKLLLDELDIANDRASFGRRFTRRYDGNRGRRLEFLLRKETLRHLCDVKAIELARVLRGRCAVLVSFVRNGVEE